MNPFETFLSDVFDVGLIIVVVLAILALVITGVFGLLRYMGIEGKQVRTWGILHHRQKRIAKVKGRLRKAAENSDEWKQLTAELETLIGSTAHAHMILSWEPKRGDRVIIVGGRFSDATGRIVRVDKSDPRMTYEVTLDNGSDYWFGRKEVQYIGPGAGERS